MYNIWSIKNDIRGLSQLVAPNLYLAINSHGYENATKRFMLVDTKAFNYDTIPTFPKVVFSDLEFPKIYIRNEKKPVNFVLFF